MICSCLKVTKCCLIGFAVSLALCGLGLMFCGSLVFYHLNGYRRFLSYGIRLPPICLVFVSIPFCHVIAPIYFGATRESPFKLSMYGYYVLAIFIAHLAPAITMLVYDAKMATTLRDTLTKSCARYHTFGADHFAWDVLQKGLECCGVDGPSDWPPNKRPVTCCRLTNKSDCNAVESGDPMLHATGCLKKLRANVHYKTLLTVATASGSVLVALVTMALTFWLAFKVKRQP